MYDVSEKIFFNASNHPELSNFYQQKMIMDGVTWYHVEGYYQARKAYDDPSVVRNIAAMPKPSDARRAGAAHIMGQEFLKTWNSGLKVHVMIRALLVKFTSSDACNRKLVSTGNAELLELSPWDAFWGTGKDGSGKNVLGKCLMKVRGIIGTPVMIQGIVSASYSGTANPLSSESVEATFRFCAPTKTAHEYAKPVYIGFVD